MNADITPPPHLESWCSDTLLSLLWSTQQLFISYASTHPRLYSPAAVPDSASASPSPAERS